MCVDTPSCCNVHILLCFNSLPPSLHAVNCEALPDITSGQITYSMVAPLPNGGYSIGTTATYACSVGAGQLFNGNAVRTCLNTGLFDGLVQQCLGVCGVCMCACVWRGCRRGGNECSV